MAVAIPNVGQSVSGSVSIPVNTGGLVSSNAAGVQLMTASSLAGAMTRSGTAQLKPILPNQPMLAPQLATRGPTGHTLIAPAPVTQTAVDPANMVASGTASRVPPIAAKPVTTSSPSSSLASQQRTSQSQSRNAPKQTMTRKRLEDLVKEIDPLEQLDEDVEEVLMQMTDDFIDSVVSHSCTLAKHRESNTLEIKDVQVHLERCWNMWIPGFGSEEVRPCKKSVTTEAHRQRLALIRKAVKK